MSPLTRTMRAVTQQRYGGTDRLVLAEVPVPSPGPGEALVRVEAAGVDRGVWHLMTGRPYLMRVIGFGLRGPKSAPGMDLAGTVAAVGAGVTGLAVGDDVVGIGTGAFAEYAVAPAAKLVARPASVSAVRAAAVPVSGITALQAVRAAGIEPGQSVLVLGAAGGVGSFALQLARHHGGEVTGVCSAAKREFVEGLGAARVVAYDEGGTAGLGPFDAIIDTGGLRSLRELRTMLAPRGTLVIVGGEGGGPLLGGIGRAVGASLLSRFVAQELVMLMSDEDPDDLAALAALLASGAVVPQVERTFTLAETAAAVDHLAAGNAVGKVVVVTRS
ncbi:NAD(P)-dependent alcohol dehydrogenase [Nocardioides sp. LHG3406-4]|uniref:NAD(P)-dependent alcohol dehydrogenase n=1 Tax=Nocardioides sp. LHG3406-4 TaxID=2804575 RepID=UPI003CF6EAAD